MRQLMLEAMFCGTCVRDACPVPVALASSYLLLPLFLVAYPLSTRLLLVTALFSYDRHVPISLPPSHPSRSPNRNSCVPTRLDLVVLARVSLIARG